MKKTFFTALLAVVASAFLAACVNDARMASHNLSQAADNFEINRRVVFYNGVTSDYILTIEGLCSLDADNPRKVAITCKVGSGTFKKHYLGVSDNVTYFIEQLEPAPANTYHYRVVFKPAVIVPDVQAKL